MKKDIEPRDVINFLNDLFYRDPDAVVRLLDFSTPCNREMADHPTMPVREGDDCFSVGLLGILNGLFDARSDGQPPICVEFSPKGEMLRFCETPCGKYGGAFSEICEERGER